MTSHGYRHLMRLAVATHAFVCVHTSAFGSMAESSGATTAWVFTISASLAGAWICMAFFEMWMDGTMKMLVALLFTTLGASGIGFLGVLVCTALFNAGAPLVLTQMPLHFIAGAMFAPHAIASNLITPVLWIGGAFGIRGLARRAYLAALRERRGQLNTERFMATQ